MSRPVVLKFLGDTSNLERSFGRVRAESTSLDTHVEHNSKRFGSHFASMGRAVVGLATGVAAVKVAGFFKEAVLSASDLGETVSKVGVVFGEAANQVTADAQFMADKFGIPKQAFLDSSAAIGLIGKASGLAQSEVGTFSTGMARLATDAASFYNVPLEEALAAIQSGLIGEAEPMRRFGVLLSENAVKEEAYAKGIAKRGAELTESQKVQARASLITKGMADATGDLERTQDSLANRMRELRGRFDNWSASMGEKAIPYVHKLLDAGERLMPTLARLGETAKMITTILFTGDFRGGPFEEDSSFVAGVFAVREAFLGLGEHVRGAWDKLKGLDWDKVVGAIQDIDWGSLGAGMNVFGVGLGFVADHADTLIRFMPILIGGFVALKVAQAANDAVGRNSIVGFALTTASTIGLATSNYSLSASLKATNLAMLQNQAATATTAATNTAATAATTGSVIGNIGRQIAAWVALGVQSMIAGAKVAAAWLISMGPIILVGAAIAGLVYLIIRNWDTIKEATGAAWDWIKDHIWGIATSIVGAVLGPVGTLVAGLARSWDTVKDAASFAWNWVKDNIVGVAAAILAGVMGPVGALVSGVARNWDSIKDATGRLVSGIGDKFGEMIEFVRGIPGKIADAIGDLGGLLFNAGKRLLGGLFRGIEDAAGKVPLVGGILKSGLGAISELFGDGWGVDQDKVAAGGLLTSGTAGHVNYLRSMGVPFGVSSTFRPGSITSSGNPSYHGTSAPGGALATDFVGPNLMAIAQAFLPVAGKLKELIYTPLGFSIKDGQRVAPYAQADHYDHVHVAYASGGIVRKKTRALLAEEGWAEAVVPLAPGRRRERERVLEDAGLAGDTVVQHKTYQITVNAETGADPHDIARDVEWVLRTAGV